MGTVAKSGSDELGRPIAGSEGRRRALHDPIVLPIVVVTSCISSSSVNVPRALRADRDAPACVRLGLNTDSGSPSAEERERRRRRQTYAQDAEKLRRRRSTRRGGRPPCVIFGPTAHRFLHCFLILMFFFDSQKKSSCLKCLSQTSPALLFTSRGREAA